MPYDPQVHTWVSEVYTVEKTVEVWLDWKGRGATAVRIEALKAEHKDINEYSTRSYVLEDLKPSALDNPANSVVRQVWVKYDAPWTSRGTADEAIRQALSFLSEIAETA